MGQSIQEWTKENLWKPAFKKSEGVRSALSRLYPFKFFKGCLPQILLGLFLNTLFQLLIVLLLMVKTKLNEIDREVIKRSECKTLHEIELIRN